LIHNKGLFTAGHEQTLNKLLIQFWWRAREMCFIEPFGGRIRWL